MNKKAQKIIMAAGIVCFIALLVIFTTAMVSVSRITGASVYDINEINLTKYVQNIELTTEHNAEYDFELEEAPENFTFKALTISGKYRYNESEGIGKFKVYLEDEQGTRYLITDSELLKELKDTPDSLLDYVTGHIIEDVKNIADANESKENVSEEPLEEPSSEAKNETGINETEIILNFKDVCEETCNLGLNDTNYVLVVEIDSGELEIDELSYWIEKNETNQTNETNLTEFSLVVEDHDGEQIYSQVSVYNKSEKKWDKINGKIDLEEGKHDVRARLTQAIKNIDIESLEVDNETKEYKIKIDSDVPLEKGYENSVQVYAIDPTEIEFDEATVTVEAQGSELWKCKDWDFDLRECQGEWTLLQSITPGEDYTFILTPEDPAYSETYQPNGTEGIDTFVNQAAPNTNYGSQTFLVAAESSGNYAGTLIKFTGNLPQGANITSATLKLYFYSSPTNATNSINLSTRLITSNWNESNVTWNTKPSYTTPYSDKETLTNNYGWIEWDVAEIVRAWLNGSANNYGIAVVPDIATANTDKRFYSSDSANTTLRPILEVNYTLEVPNITLIWPENATQHGDGDVWLGYRVESNESIANCSLIYNETVYGTDNNISTGTLQRQKLTVNNDNFYIWYINCTTSSGIVGSSEKREITINTSKADFYGWVENAQGNKINVTVDFIQNEVIKFTSAGTIHALVLEDGIYNITVSPANNPVKNVTFRDINITRGFTKIVDIDDPPAGGWNKLYVVNPYIGNASNNDTVYVTVTAAANSKVLYKCSDWNFTTQTCEGEWIEWADIQPGQEYTRGFIVGDPALGEGNGTFFEGFESGSFATNNWTDSGTGSNWTIGAYSYAGTYSARGMPVGGLRYLETNISTVGYSNITFSYYAETSGLDAGEYCGADWYNGSAWIQVDSFQTIFPYALRNFSLPASASNNANFRIRFKISASANNEKCYIDNVNVSGIAAAVDNPPTTTLVSPANNSTDTDVNINFTCNATDDLQLKNISLYITNSSNQSFALNQTTNISGISNSSQWILNLSVGNYTWNCLTYDNASQGDWGDANRTLKINYTGDITPPNITWLSQNPADIDTINIFGIKLNITYNISDTSGINESSVIFYYKTNTTTSDVFYYVNGTAVSGYQTSDVNKTNVSDTWNFSLQDNVVYPATYNFNESALENTQHQNYTLASQNNYVKIRLFNVSNTKNYSMFEVMASNNTVTSTSLRIYYCNSSYASGSPATSNYCTNFYNINSSTPYNHTHTSYSSHHVAPFSMNVSSGELGNVVVTSTSYFLLRGPGTGSWNVSYISNVSRTDTIQTSANSGNAWSDFSGTVDSHLHQYDGSDTFRYYVCANDTLGNGNCSTARYDLINLNSLPPTAPNVYNPTTGTYSGNITINYTEAISPNGYPITHYNISLVYPNETFVQTIKSNNSLNLSYIWNSSEAADGEYLIRVQACDNQSQCSYGYSENITIDNTPEPTQLLFSVNQTVYPQGRSPGHGYDIYIPFQARYIDNVTSNPVDGATCYVTNNETSDNVTLTYNATTGNYTGQVNDYLMYDVVGFNATCSKASYNTSSNSTATNVWWFNYLWEWTNTSYGSSNNYTTHWLRKENTTGTVYTLTKSLGLLSLGSTLIEEFPFCGAGTNCSFLKDYSMQGLHYLRLNLSVTSLLALNCKPYLCVAVKDWNLNELVEHCIPEQSISADTPTVIEGNLSENCTIRQNDYLFLKLYLNCTLAVGGNVSIYYNYTGQPTNLEIRHPHPTQIASYIHSWAQIENNYTIGPNATSNITRKWWITFNNTASDPRDIEYYFTPQIKQEYPNSNINGTIYVYNSTGQLWASDNASAGAPYNATSYSDNRVSWTTETIPGSTAINETLQRGVLNAIRDNETMVYNASEEKIWNITLYDVFFPEVTIYNVTVWTNYSSYGAEDDWGFEVNKTNNTGTYNITSEITVNTTAKTITMPQTNLSNITYTVLAKDKTPPNITFISPTPDNGTLLNYNWATINASVTNNVAVDTCLLNWNGTNESMIKIGTGNNVTCEKNKTSLSDGNYTYKIYANDTSNNWNVSETRVVRIDTQAPTIQFASPTETSGSTINRNYTQINVTANDSGSGLKNITIYLFNSSGALINSTNSTSSPLFSNFTNLNNDLYYFNATAYDNANNSNSTETRNVTIDTIAPNITFISPTPPNGTTQNYSYATINATVTDNMEVDGCELEWQGTNESMNKVGSGSNVTCWLNKTGLSSGTYTYKVYANDIVDNWGVSETRQVTINITATYTVNGTITDAQGNPVAATIEFYDNDTGNLTASGNETYNFSLEANNSYDIRIVPATGAIDELYVYNYTLCTNITNIVNLEDTPENVSTPIELLNWTEFIAWQPNETCGYDSVRINFSYGSGTNLEFWKCAAWNYTNRSCTGENWTFVQNLTDGPNTTVLYFNAGDPGGGGGPKDNIPPVVTLNAPANGSTTGDTTPDFNFTTTDNKDPVMQCELFINDTGYGTTNTAQNNTTEIITANSSLASGFYEWYVNCTDNKNNVGQSATWFLTIDAIAPVITNVNATSITASSATVVWDTDENANSTVNYGTTVALGTFRTNAAFVTSHSIALTGLSASRLYYYNVTSCDTFGNCNTTGTFNFTTLAGGGGGGGGGAGGAPVVLPPTPEVPEEYEICNITVPLQENNFSTCEALGENDRIYFELKNVTHYIAIETLTLDYIDITLYSSPQQAQIWREKAKSFDLDEDGKDDILITFNNATGGKASVTVILLKCVCPECGDWSTCLKDKQHRVCYKCNEETNYTCQAYEETKDCVEKPKVLINWLLVIKIILIIVVALFLGYSIYRIFPRKTGFERDFTSYLRKRQRLVTDIERKVPEIKKVEKEETEVLEAAKKLIKDFEVNEKTLEKEEKKMEEVAKELEKVSKQTGEKQKSIDVILKQLKEVYS